jgi:hypothetical protein
VENPVLEQPKPQKPEEQSFFEANRLRISALLNLAGDIGVMVDGKKKGDYLHGFAGLLYTFGATVAALFGTVSPKQHLKELKFKAASFLAKETDGGQSDKAQSELASRANESTMARVTRYLRGNSAKVMLWFYSLGAAAMLANGIRKYAAGKNKDGKRPIADILVGGFSLLVKLSSALLPQASPEEEQELGNRKKSWWHSIKSQPMKLFGYGSFLTEIFWAYSVYEDQQNKQPWKWRAFTTASYAASDLMITGTKKETRAKDLPLTTAQQSELEELMAETIAKQEESQQEELTRKAVSFLEENTATTASEEVLFASLQQRVKEQRKPWGERSQETERVLALNF